MNEISLHKVLPDAFADSDSRESEIWLRDVSFSRGKNYLLMAESGRGKSTFCEFLMGLRDDYSGKVSFDGEDVRRFGCGAWTKLRKSVLAFVPQRFIMFPSLTVWENIIIKNQLVNYKTPAEIREMLESLEIGEKIDNKVSTLSIGQQQRVAIIRALCQPADFYILDEPVSHLDGRNNSLVAALIQREALKNGASIIATSVGYSISIDFTKILRL